jgi:(p)ppGpp synthase/HD superfamily hydrolase
VSPASEAGAVGYAREIHRGQRRRSDDAPFLAHLLEVAGLLREAGASEELVAAGVLHDAIEKAHVSAEDLRVRFGEHVTELVLAVTEDPAITGYGARKLALRTQVAAAGEEALMLFAADKVAKVRELVVGRTRSAPRRLAHYEASLDLLEARRPWCVLTQRLSGELARLAARQPALAANR